MKTINCQCPTAKEAISMIVLFSIVLFLLTAFTTGWIIMPIRALFGG